MASNRFSEQDYDRIYRRDAFTCVYCGFDGHAFENWMQLELDHVIPISQEGKDTDDNLVTCCPHCNKVTNGMQDLKGLPIEKILSQKRDVVMKDRKALYSRWLESQLPSANVVAARLGADQA